MTHLDLAAKFRRSNTTEGTGITFSHAECEMAAGALEAAAALAAEHIEDCAARSAPELLAEIMTRPPLRLVPNPSECGGSCGRRPDCADDS